MLAFSVGRTFILMALTLRNKRTYTKIIIICVPLFLTACADNNPLIGKWIYSPDRIVFDLKENPNTPSKILRCFETKVCGHNTAFEHTDNQWRQITTHQDGTEFKSDYTDYEIIHLSNNKVLFSTIVDGAPQETTFTIIDNNNISYVTELDGFEWTEYLQREN